MTTKVVNAIKYFGLLSLVFITLVSCEKEIESVGVSLVDNNNFSANKTSFEVLVTNENIQNVPANGISQYLLGVYSDPEFGKLKASIITQLNLPAFGDNYNYGDNVGIDSVIINIPYQSTLEESYSDGKPKFSIDSVFGDTDKEFKIEVFELKTFLNTLDPNDPSKNAIYFSDKEFQKGDTPLYSGNFKVNANDTVAYIKRYNLDGVTVYSRDTIKESSVAPSIKLPLNEALIKQLFIDNASEAEFTSRDEFYHYFRGLYIQASELDSEISHLISLNMANANMTIYYSNDENEGADEDLNGNDVKGEGIVRVKQKYIFSFGSIKSNFLERDDTNSQQSGSDRLYVQGASGSQGIIELFNGEDLENLQSNNWLITDANLVFYVDQNASSNIAPEQLFLYNYDGSIQIDDVLIGGLVGLGGQLERDEEGNPYRYVFKITEYISELLKKLDEGEEASVDLVRLGLKVYNPTDLPTSSVDIKVRDYSWNPKGVVLFNHNSSAGDKKVKLEVFYTELN